MKTYGLASDHMKTLGLLVVPSLKTLKKTGVYSCRSDVAKVIRPKGPTPPVTFEPFKLHKSSGFVAKLVSNVSALSRLPTLNVTSTSTCIYVHILGVMLSYIII